MPWNNFLVVWAAALPPPTCFPHTVLWLSPRGGLNHSHLFQLGTYMIPVFCFGFLIPSQVNSPLFLCCQKAKVRHSSSGAAAPAASSAGWTPTVSERRGLGQTWFKIFEHQDWGSHSPSVPACSPFLGKCALHSYRQWPARILAWWEGLHQSLFPVLEGGPKPPKESLECPCSRALCALQPVHAACQ